MGEKFPLNWENKRSLLNPQKINHKKTFNFEDFLYLLKKQEILILSKTKKEKKNIKHPFQEFLYALRKENIKISTSEWIDLQKILDAGEIENIDDLYIVSRTLLIKDVTDYDKFDKIFGKFFYDIDFQEQNQEEDEENNNYENNEEEEEKNEEDIKEEGQLKEKNQSQEIVDPGDSEEHHGGKDFHKEIKNSKSSGHEGGGILERNNNQEELENQEKTEENKNQNKKKIIIKKEKLSTIKKINDRKYKKYDKDQILNYEQFGRALSKIITIIKETTKTPTDKLDIKETIKNIAENGVITTLTWQEKREKRPKLILMFDVGGSTDSFRPIMEKLFAAAKDYLDDVEIYYFHNAIYGEVWPHKDGNYGKNFIPLSEILKKEEDSRVIIVGDAWMADYELYEDDRGENGQYIPSGLESFKKLKNAFHYIVWLNPIKEEEHDEWDSSGTIAEIKNIFKMYDLTLNGLEKAVKDLIED